MFQYTITNQPQHIKYKQYKPSIEWMQAHYKYSLHMCPSARGSVLHFVKISSPMFKTHILGGHEKQMVGAEKSILKSQDIKNIHITQIRLTDNHNHSQEYVSEKGMASYKVPPIERLHEQLGAVNWEQIASLWGEQIVTSASWGLHGDHLRLLIIFKCSS